MISNDRLLCEIREVKSRQGIRHFELFEDTSRGKDQWDRYFWAGRAPTGHLIMAIYAPEHPYRKMRLFIHPDVDTHHKLPDGSACYIKDPEWGPHWTAATVIFTAFRFLDDYRKGKL